MTRLAILVAALAGGTLAASASAQAPSVPAPVPKPIRDVCARKPQPAIPPSRKLLDAFEVLRRERTPADELPKAAADALRARGLAFRAATARRVATTAAGGGTWLVPVRDVNAAAPFLCFERPRAVRGPRRPRIRSAAPAVPPPIPAKPSLAPPPRPKPAPSRRARRRRPVPMLIPPYAVAPPVAFPQPRPAKPAEGVVVVATRDAALYGGGSVDDIVNATAPVEIDPCAGTGRTVAVRGLVPDGVDAVWLTGPDGTAVRTNPRDNTFTIVLVADRRPQMRYVVWNDAAGKPRVQPVPFLVAAKGACRRARAPRDLPRISAGCGAAFFELRVAPMLFGGGGCPAGVLPPLPRRRP